MYALIRELWKRSGLLCVCEFMCEHECVCVRELGSVYDVLCFASVLPPITEDLINLLAIKFLN